MTITADFPRTGDWNGVGTLLLYGPTAGRAAFAIENGTWIEVDAERVYDEAVSMVPDRWTSRFAPPPFTPAMHQAQANLLRR